ncbi:CotG/ExsB N-terminal domain-containing protein [Priestia sp. 179-F W1.4 NHS]|uniref:CotG/ExsB N-terminal domain-containing protein n=1 Tax=Priestia sp. 179-F W1.4 NHS TaxID=3374296 RepID=UPI0038790CFB
MHITAERIREATEALASTELETFMYQEPTALHRRSRRRSTRRSTRRTTRRTTRRSTRRTTRRTTRRSTRRSTRRTTRRTTRRSTRRSSHRRCRCGSPCCSYPWFNKSFGCCFKGHGCSR